MSNQGECVVRYPRIPDLRDNGGNQAGSTDPVCFDVMRLHIDADLPREMLIFAEVSGELLSPFWFKQSLRIVPQAAPARRAAQKSIEGGPKSGSYHPVVIVLIQEVDFRMPTEAHNVWPKSGV